MTTPAKTDLLTLDWNRKCHKQMHAQAFYVLRTLNESERKPQALTCLKALSIYRLASVRLQYMWMGSLWGSNGLSDTCHFSKRPNKKTKSSHQAANSLFTPATRQKQSQVKCVRKINIWKGADLSVDLFLSAVSIKEKEKERRNP